MSWPLELEGVTGVTGLKALVEHRKRVHELLERLQSCLRRAESTMKSSIHPGRNSAKG